MSINKDLIKQQVKDFQFKDLFNALGWDNPDNNSIPIKIGETTYILKDIAQKKGFFVYLCKIDDDFITTNNLVRKKIEQKITKIAYEHLIIFENKNKTTQIWQFNLREKNKPLRIREFRFDKHQSSERFAQKLAQLVFTLEEEESLGIIDVTKKAKAAFDVEKVTKAFYTRFKAEHGAFIKFISGIDNQADRQWYTSLMLNRLMFIYFIQKKSFLDSNVNYLKDKLKEIKKKKGKDKFQSFYRYFLLTLFHHGLGSSVRTPDETKLLGNIPYLNGGLFDVHEIEKTYDSINIPDKAFDKIFAFFDEYEWHLDTRMQVTGKEINPDVLGFIFEKYINDRANMGAYYTKEDITEYISKNCIIPFLFDETIRNYNENAFDFAFEMLRENPNRYIYDAIKNGIPKDVLITNEIITDDILFADLPDEIKSGFNPKLEKKVVNGKGKYLYDIRKPWNKKAPESIALPTEIYRELIDRRNRYKEIRGKIAAGEINSINDFITFNLDIRQFTQDAIEHSDDPLFIEKIYKAIKKISVLDPTCGSGAFLFAALNILEPLYEACIGKMEDFLEDAKLLKRVKKQNKAISFGFFEDELTNIHSPAHPNKQYFIYKSIILNNLYGVDLMKEAVEIAKLRLFLKLVSTVDANYSKPNLGLEPLPDMDFNIKSGNTLVGYVSIDELQDSMQNSGRLDFDEELKKELLLLCGELATNMSKFKKSQEDKTNAESQKQLKEKISNQLSILEKKTDQTYAKYVYNVEINNKKQYNKWLSSHQPFHWFYEFFEIISQKGGFDVIIGNPPYLEMRQVDYEIKSLFTRDSNAIHSMCIEKSNVLLNSNGAMSMIVPVALVCTQRMIIAQNIIEKDRATWYSNFSWRPAKLFDQVNRALTIFITVKNKKQVSFSTGYQKWNAEHREFLFPVLQFNEYSNERASFWFPKISSKYEIIILNKVLNAKSSIPKFIGQSNNRVYYRTTGGLYWKVFTNYSPKFYLNGKEGKSSRETSFSLIGSNNNLKVVGLLSSNTFWWWYTITSNLRDLNPSDINGFRFPENLFENNLFLNLCTMYLKNLDNNSEMLQREQKNKGLTETQSFKISKSKPIIDQIDTVLAEHYGFTEEELDFIINYDIKYRMGKELDAYIDGTLGKREENE